MLLEPVKLPAEIRYQLAGCSLSMRRCLGLRRRQTTYHDDQGVSQEAETGGTGSARQVELVIQGSMYCLWPDKQQQMLDLFPSWPRPTGPR